MHSVKAEFSSVICVLIGLGLQRNNFIVHLVSCVAKMVNWFDLNGHFLAHQIILILSYSMHQNAADGILKSSNFSGICLWAPFTF